MLKKLATYTALNNPHPGITFAVNNCMHDRPGIASVMLNEGTIALHKSEHNYNTHQLFIKIRGGKSYTVNCLFFCVVNQDGLAAGCFVFVMCRWKQNSLSVSPKHKPLQFCDVKGPPDIRVPTAHKRPWKWVFGWWGGALPTLVPQRKMEISSLHI